MSDLPPSPDDATDTARMKAALVAAAAVAFAAAPLAVPFDGFEPGAYPVPQDDPPVQPAGYAFGIWGPIYLWLVAHALYGLVRRSDSARWEGTRWPMALSLAVGAGWLAIAQVSPIWATVLIWVMLLSALLALWRAPEREDRWLLRAPISLYAGWLTAASWVAVGLLGAGYGVGPGEVGWAWIGLAGALATALAVTRLAGPAPFYAAAVAWALIAVAVANWGAQWGLVAAALGGAAVVAAPALARLRAG
ncbi:hypothetical protein [Rhodovulum sp. 12E13]|uniref:hypothetical protein n=1 Tax=Rhodovulum sp. 12E13 TaxID=2203891 RepID=UPI001F1DD208|nr:hypothetical protein [Rhodovulum sp. 12E13]